MAQYRIVFIDVRTGEEASTTVIEAADDREAMEHVIHLRDDRDIEIWRDERLVIRIAPIIFDISEE
jgi:hypothetical protein